MAIRLLHFRFGSSISSGSCLGTWWENKRIELFNELDILVEEGGNVMLKVRCKDLNQGMNQQGTLRLEIVVSLH